MRAVERKAVCADRFGRDRYDADHADFVENRYEGRGSAKDNIKSGYGRLAWTRQASFFACFSDVFGMDKAAGSTL